MRVLVIGKDRGTLERIKADLGARGIVADGTTDMHTASERFDAGDFDLVALGGGLDSPARARLKADFEAQNPNTILLDVFAPVAVEQIDRALRGELDKREFASRFEVTEDAGACVVHLDIVKQATLRVQVYHLGETLEGATVAERSAPRGPVEIRIDVRDMHPGANMILVTLEDREFYIHRFERPPLETS